MSGAGHGYAPDATDPTRPPPDGPRSDQDARITPFLVMKLTPGDTGARPVMQAMQEGMATLVVGDEATPDQDNGFTVFGGNQRLIVSGEVTNLGRSPALMGIARLYIVDGVELTANFGGSATPFDVTDFQAAAGKPSRFRFRRPWLPMFSVNPLARRISIFIHVVDLAGDSAPFVLDNGGLESRHRVRRDFLVATN